MKEAIYAFSGDPITYGHIDIIERSLEIFDRVVVGIGVNPQKRYSFSLDVRKKMAERALSKYGDRIQVEAFEGLLVDFAYMKSIKTIIRGIRNEADFNFEKEMYNINITQKGIDVVSLFTKPELSHISSSAAKEIQKNQGNVVDFVPPYVKQSLEALLLNQGVIGITGEIGAGKTYIANALCGIGKDKPVHNIDLDTIGRDLLTKDTRPFAKKMRENLIDIFDQLRYSGPDKFIDVKSVSFIFKDPILRGIYNNRTKEPILFQVYQEMRGKTGLILLNSALLAEGNLMPMCNNNVILVHASEEVRIDRLRKRGYSGEELKNRMSAQLGMEAKKQIMDRAIEKDGWGQVLCIENNGLNDASFLNNVLDTALKTAFPDWAAI